MADFEINVKCPECTTKQSVLVNRPDNVFNFVDENCNDIVVCVEPEIICCARCECDFVVDLEVFGEASTRKIEGANK